METIHDNLLECFRETFGCKIGQNTTPMKLP